MNVFCNNCGDEMKGVILSHEKGGIYEHGFKCFACNKRFIYAYVLLEYEEFTHEQENDGTVFPKNTSNKPRIRLDGHGDPEEVL